MLGIKNAVSLNLILPRAEIAARSSSLAWTSSMTSVRENHQGLDNQLLQRPPPPVRADADVQRRERLGGLLSFYYREAA